MQQSDGDFFSSLRQEPPTFLDLPTDVIHLVLQLLPKRCDLVAFAGASLQCEDLANSILYNTLKLNSGRRLAETLEKIRGQSKSRRPDAFFHVRHLVVEEMACSNLKDGFDAEAIRTIHTDVIPQLSFLLSLVWSPESSAGQLGDVITAINTYCPELQSLYVRINLNDSESLEQLSEVTDLRDIHIEFRTFAPSQSVVHIPEPVKVLISGSPNLRSLSLDFYIGVINRMISGRAWSLLEWATDDLFDYLANVSPFRWLQVLRLGGIPQLDWDALFEDPAEHLEYQSPSWRFIARHRRLHTVSLGWTDDQDITEAGRERRTILESESVLDPAAVSALFPALKHFEGPTFMCTALAQSRISKNLQSLVLSGGYRPHEPYDLVNFANNLTCLPNLQCLKLGPRLSSSRYLRLGNIPEAIIQKMLIAMPALSDLELDVINKYPDSLAEALKHAPRLTTLVVGLQNSGYDRVPFSRTPFETLNSSSGLLSMIATNRSCEHYWHMHRPAHTATLVRHDAAWTTDCPGSIRIEGCEKLYGYGASRYARFNEWSIQ